MKNIFENAIMIIGFALMLIGVMSVDGEHYLISCGMALSGIILLTLGEKMSGK